MSVTATVLGILGSALAMAKMVIGWITNPARRRRSVLDQIEKDRQETLHKVDNLTSLDRADREKARKELLKDIRE
jgi:hypothetical protein